MVLTKDGSIIKVLPDYEPDSHLFSYTYVNDYMACGYLTLGMTTQYYFVVDISTKEFIQYDSYIPFEGTQYIIVTEKLSEKFRNR